MSATIMQGDACDRLQEIPDGTIQTCVTSPPYWGLRDYGNDNQIGLEETPEQYVARLLDVFAEVHRVLADDGTLWVNIGDSYNGSGGAGGDYGKGGLREGQPKYPGRNVSSLKPKDLVGVPWRLAFALQEQGWWLRQDIIWSKPNPMPEPVNDRCTKAHEYLFLLSKSRKYFYNPDFEGSHPRSVWEIPTQAYSGAHFAVMPEKLVLPCIKAGSRPLDSVLDPFAGSGTVGVVALRENRRFVGVELNPEYAKIAHQRIMDDQPLFNAVDAL